MEPPETGKEKEKEKEIKIPEIDSSKWPIVFEQKAKVILFWTSATASLKIKKDIQEIRFLLAGKRVKWEEYDVCYDGARRKEMKDKSSKNTLPQLFINDIYIGNFDNLQQLEEEEKLIKLLIEPPFKLIYILYNYISSSILFFLVKYLCLAASIAALSVFFSSTLGSSSTFIFFSG